MSITGTISKEGNVNVSKSEAKKRGKNPFEKGNESESRNYTPSDQAPTYTTSPRYSLEHNRTYVPGIVNLQLINNLPGQLARVR